LPPPLVSPRLYAAADAAAHAAMPLYAFSAMLIIFAPVERH